MINTKISVDDRQFRDAYKKYVAYSKKSLEDIANKTAFEISKIAVKQTAGSDKSKIADELNKTVVGNATLAAIIVNKNRGAEGKKGFYGEKMAKAAAKFIRKRQSSAYFLQQGWLAAVKQMAPFVKDKKGATVPQKKGAKAKLGGAYPAKAGNNQASAVIFNSIVGGKREGSVSSRVIQKLQEGLQKAVNIKTKDMYAYVKKKVEEGAEYFNRL